MDWEISIELDRLQLLTSTLLRSIKGSAVFHDKILLFFLHSPLIRPIFDAKKSLFAFVYSTNFLLNKVACKVFCKRHFLWSK